MPEKPHNFWQELKRRKVIRVITVYAAAAFVILELVDIVAPSLGLPAWTLNFIIVLLCVGFILSIILSWIYDITPEGVQKTKPLSKETEPKKEMPSSTMGWKIATYSSLVVIIGLLMINIFKGEKQTVELEKSIAVLPFDNMSDGEEYSWFGDAITDEVIMQLYKIHAFDVRSRTSIMQYKNSDKASPTIGQELNVNYLLEGSAQRYEDQVRIRVQLIHASTDNHIWGEIFEGDWKNIFEIQIKVAKQVARELQAVLTPEEVERIENEPTENIEAYNLYLKGRYFYNQEGREGLDKSIEFYRQALEIDPEYALAYSGMAATYTSYATSGYFPRKDVLPQAKAAALRALEIDNQLGEAHAELAYARVIHDWDWIGGEEGFKRAIELNPNYASAHSKYAWLLTYLGRFEEAIQEDKRAIELDPLSVGNWVDLGRRYYFSRNYDKATDELRKILEVFPNSGDARYHLALALSQKGLHDEAINECLKVKEIIYVHWYLGYIYAAAGKRDQALEILNYYQDLAKNEFVWLSNFTFIYAGLGEIEKAFECLEKTYELREAWLDLLKVEPMYDNLRTDPRFQDLLDRMNFPD